MRTAGSRSIMGKILPSGAEVVSSESYPAVVPKADVARFIAHLKSEETRAIAEAAMTSARGMMHGALKEYVRILLQAAQTFDLSSIYAQAHEIRGVAETAGFGVAGRMANGLCQYIDALDGAPADRTTVQLHVEAIERVVGGKDEGAIALVVAEELTALVLRKLGETKAKTAAE